MKTTSIEILLLEYKAILDDYQVPRETSDVICLLLKGSLINIERIYYPESVMYDNFIHVVTDEYQKITDKDNYFIKQPIIFWWMLFKFVCEIDHCTAQIKNGCGLFAMMKCYRRIERVTKKLAKVKYDANPNGLW